MTNGSAALSMHCLDIAGRQALRSCVAYQGRTLDACGLVILDLEKVEVVAVSGSGPNVCGHLLLFMPSGGGYYFQVSSVFGYPYYMNQAGFRRYLKENGKRELRRFKLALPKPDAAAAYLEMVMSEEWLWGVLPHNCVAFCEGVIRAGGSQWSSYSNCPALAADVPQHTLNEFLSRLDWEIRRAYLSSAY